MHDPSAPRSDFQKPQASTKGCGPGTELTRRQLGGVLGALFSYSLLGTLAGCDAFPRAIGPTAQAWLKDMQALAEAVKGAAIPQVEWQARAEELFRQVDRDEFLAMIDFEALIRSKRTGDVREPSVDPRLPRVEGLPRELDFATLLFCLERGQSIPPHGHYNMVTGFVVLGGEFRARHFDRLEEHEDHMLLVPTIDETFTVGSTSTISDYRDNVHWFETRSEVGYLFNVHVHHVDPTIAKHGRVFVDPTGAPLADGRIHAPKLDRKTSFARFGEWTANA